MRLKMCLSGLALALLLGFPSAALAAPFDGAWEGGEDPPRAAPKTTAFSFDVTAGGTALAGLAGNWETRYPGCSNNIVSTGGGVQMPIAPDGSFGVFFIPGFEMTGRFTSRNEASGTYTVQCPGQPEPRQTFNWKATLKRPANPAVMVRPEPKRPGCLTEITVGTRVAWSPCFERAGDGFRSTEHVRLSGLDLQPNPGSAVSLSDRGLVTGNMKVSLRSGADVLPNNEWTLWDGDFRLDATKQRVLSLKPPKAAGPVRVGGLSVLGKEIELAWTSDGAEIKLALEAGKELQPVAGAVLDPPGQLKRGLGLEGKLKATNESGMVLDAISAELDLGEGFAHTGKAFLLKSVKLTYHPWDQIWSGSATLSPTGGRLKRLGRPDPELTVDVGMTLVPSVGFAWLKASLQNINKHLGYGVFLQEVGGEIKRLPAPWQLVARSKLSLGPKLKDSIPYVGGKYAVDLDGDQRWTPWFTISQGGAGHVLGQPFTDANAEVDLATGSADVAGNVNLSIANTGLRGFLNGWIQGGQFQFQGDAELTVVGRELEGGRALINGGGIAGCKSWAGPDWGFSIDWRSGFDVRVMSHSCDFGDLVVERPRQSQATGARTFVVPRGSRGVGLRLHSDAGDPAVLLKGPGGVQLTVPATAGVVDTPQLSALRDSTNHDLYVALASPRRGRWTVEPLPGSPPIASLARASALPEPSIRARVHRRAGGRRVLTYRVRRIPGQRIRFVERGPAGLARVLGTTGRRRGRIVFTPGGTSVGRHSIEAVVLQSGSPRDARTVARFGFRPSTLSAPRRLRARRGRGGVTLRWRRVAGARRYLITGRLRDGRRIEIVSRRARLRLRADRSTTGRLTVRALSAGGQQGRARSVRLR